jgi:hypothetical protein
LLNSSSPDGLQVGFLPGQQRSIRGQLLTDRVEEVSQLAELVAGRHVERHAELALAQARQSAPQHVNRPQQKLREDTAHEDGHGERTQRREPRVPEQVLELTAHQQRGHSDANRTEGLALAPQRFPDLEVPALPREDFPKLRDRRLLEQRLEIVAPGQGAFVLRRLIHRRPGRFAWPLHDDHAVGIDDGGDGVAVDAGFENRAKALVLAQRGVGIDVPGDDPAGPVQDGIDQHLSPLVAFVEHHVGQTDRVERAQRHDGQADDGGHSDDLLDPDAQAHVTAAPIPLRCASPGYGRAAC